MPLKVLHIIATLSGISGGPATACVAMAEAVRRRGHKVDIFTTDWKASPSDLPVAPASENIHVFPVRPPLFWKRSPELAAALRRHISSYDVIDIHSLYLFHNMVGPAAARSAGVPYIIRPHGLLDPYIWRRHRWRKFLAEIAFQNRALRQAAAIHYTSADEMRISAPYAHGTPGVIVPLGVELPPAVSFGSRKPHRILFLSRLHPKKGLDLLIPAFARVKASIPDAELVIAGPDDGALRSTTALVEKHGLQHSVSFPDMLRGAEKASVFAEAGLFVLPSYSENFGIALAEAMAAGIPVVATDQVNIHDAVQQAEAGLIVKCEMDALAAAMLRLLQGRELAARMGANGRALAAKCYSWPAIGELLEALYEKVIAKKAFNG